MRFLLEMKEAAEIMQALKAYGMIRPVTGVIYPEGTHEEMIKRAESWLWSNRAKIQLAEQLKYDLDSIESTPTISDKELVLKTRIEERKLCIYIIEQDLMDHSEGDDAYSEDYFTALIDEVMNHKNYITDYETELNQLKG